jgi:hypothetical protein
MLAVPPTPRDQFFDVRQPAATERRGDQMGSHMRRLFLPISIVLLAATSVMAVPAAWAGSPHFVDDTVTCSTSGNTLTCSGKEAGLGDEAQVHIVVSATAECINPGSNHPQAATRRASRLKVISRCRTAKQPSA